MLALATLAASFARLAGETGTGNVPTIVMERRGDSAVVAGSIPGFGDEYP